ncbi:Rieske 2Fe-2S domain-containing protein [Streptomyces sp. NPDC057424]|uniref:Rieske 2Fe-2S domain-containing protein n=1 Tax=Streptomyces sp. NPDC057424 TaxID=3346127 RepID=UPI00367C5ACF
MTETDSDEAGSSRRSEHRDPRSGTVDPCHVGANPDVCYPVALSGSVRRERVFAASFAGERVALHRGQSGAVRALEGRCAHRQVWPAAARSAGLPRVRRTASRHLRRHPGRRPGPARGHHHSEGPAIPQALGPPPSCRADERGDRHPTRNRRPWAWRRRCGVGRPPVEPPVLPPPGRRPRPHSSR